MRVLVIEDRDRQIEPAVAALREADHDVTFCHEPGDAAFDCNGMPGRAGCPLDDGSIDVAVLGCGAGLGVGTGCALRHRVPVVLVGARTPVELPAWAADGVDIGDLDLVEQIDAAAREGRAPIIEAIEATTRAALERTLPGQVRVVGRMIREHGRLRVTVDIGAELDGRIRDRVAVRVAGAVRTLVPSAPTIDVAVFDSTTPG